MDEKIYRKKMKEFKQTSSQKEFDTSTLEEFEITDGKNRDDEKKHLQDLEKLFGIKDVNHYGTTNRAIFKESLSDMSLSEMQTLAMRVGVPASRNRFELRRLLYNSFDSFLKRSDYGIASERRPVIDPNSPEHKKAVKLLSEGL